jgi:exodeoxyribonuclease V alpha subunit
MGFEINSKSAAPRGGPLHHCDQCRTAIEEKSQAFEQSGKSFRFCNDCWNAFPTLRGPLEVLNYGTALTSLPGVGLSLAKRIAQVFTNGDARKEMLKENPYALTRVRGLGFLKVDKIAMWMGISPTDPKRAAAATVYVLEEASNEGHTWMTESGVTQAVAKFNLKPLFEQSAVYCHGDGQVSLKSLFMAEQEIAQRLFDLVQAESWNNPVFGDFGDAKDQPAALRSLLSQRLFVLLGAAGTGKTTLIKQLLENIKAVEGASYVLAAPTGKAARRMKEATLVDALTIHRLLEARPSNDGGFRFQRDQNIPLDYRWVIIDESSMCDVYLMRSLLRALRVGSRLILVGDPYQLASVGPGDVLRDLTNGHGVVPYVSLTQVKRQEPGELLALNCQRVREGLMVQIDNENAKDFFFADMDDPKEIVSEIVSLVSTRLPEKFGVDTKQIQVLSALREVGEVSVSALNLALREKLNPEAAGNKEFQSGDRVVQTSNDYDLGVMNGELGTITESHPKVLLVAFDNIGEVEIPRWKKSLEFAWALTVHKFQGSQAEWVIIPVHRSMGRVAKRRWAYTAISRGKHCIMLGDRNELGRIIGRQEDSKRQTNLERFLVEIQALHDSDRSAGETPADI